MSTDESALTTKSLNQLITLPSTPVQKSSQSSIPSQSLIPSIPTNPFQVQQVQPVQQQQTQIDLTSVVEITGIVLDVRRKPAFGHPTEFTINFPKSNRTFSAVGPDFFPIQKGDTIYGFARIISNVLHLVSNPFVQPATDRDTIIQCLMRAIRISHNQADRVYKALDKASNGQVVTWLTDTSQQWMNTHNPDLLTLFEGLDIDKAKIMLYWWHRERNLRRLYLLGLTKQDINACRLTCDEIYSICMDNPYRLPAIPMEKCENILNRNNKTGTHDQKICGQIVRAIWENMHHSGWTSTPYKHLGNKFPRLSEYLTELETNYGVVFDADYRSAYMKFPHTVENWVHDFVRKMVMSDRIKYDTPLDQNIETTDGKTIFRASAHYRRDMSPDQRAAIQGALDHTFCIITGGAGVGKTTCTAEILHNLDLRGVHYLICSFTGKAVARLREVTKKRTPMTIHRAISIAKKGQQVDYRPTSFEKRSEPKEYEHILIDEASMLSMPLFYDLMQAYPKVKKITLIGDDNQLPPIEWGSLFQQLIKSSTVPTYRLTTNYRVYTENGTTDGIIANANRIISHNNESAPFFFRQSENFRVINGPIERVYDLIALCFKSGITANQVVILSPFNRDLPLLNQRFQHIYNVGSRFVVDKRNIKWMIGDRVMLTENDEEINVFNGETGFVKDVNEKAIMVDFGNSGCHEFLLEGLVNSDFSASTTGRKKYRGRNVDEVKDGYEGEDVEGRTVLKLTHGFAMTVDKSQGSEWDFIIIYISDFGHSSFLSNKRFYTALTRAKRCEWLVVSNIEAAEKTAVSPHPYRWDNLSKRLVKDTPVIEPFDLQIQSAQAMLNDQHKYDEEDDYDPPDENPDDD